VVKLLPASAFESRLVELRRQLDAPALQALEPKALHLAVAALAVTNTSDDAAVHGLAARRAGASWAEIEAIGALVERFGGLAASGKASAFVLAVQALEQHARVEGAVAAYA
jgi:4-carboxymuconolactone decarboxylase